MLLAPERPAKFAAPSETTTYSPQKDCTVADPYDLETYWPVEQLKQEGFYFYLKEIAEYLPNSWVRVEGSGNMIMLGSYSYLGLIGHPRINRAAHEAVERYGTGVHGVQLLAGSLDIHRRLETCIARIKQAEAAALFSSGYAANTSTISCLLGRHDTVICDKLDHASIVDGCQLSQAKLQRFKHNDMANLEAILAGCDRTHKRLVIVDGVYSMDGDIANLPEISRLCKKYGAWLMVDEAHSFGVIGETGRGIEEHFHLPADAVDIKMGTFGKAIPSQGAYVAGSEKLVRYLKHQARGFIYSGALSPVASAAALAALDVLETEPNHIRRLHENMEFFSKQLRGAGFSILNSESAVFPILCRDNAKAHQLANYCQHRGIFVQAIPHPVVPMGTARLRAAVNAAHLIEDLAYCVSVLREGAELIGGVLNNK